LQLITQLDIKFHKNKNKTLSVFSYFYQTYGVQQYMIKDSLGLGFMIQFKGKAPNIILLIPTLAFTPYVTTPNVLVTSLNLNNKNPNVLTMKYKTWLCCM